MSLNKPLTAALLTCLITLAGCDRPAAPPPLRQKVLVTAVHHQPAGEERLFTAVIRARREADLAFRTGGRVAERLIELGQAVAAGEPLARLDPADHQLAVAAAEEELAAAHADARQAAADAARLKRLMGKDSAAEADHERQQARAEATRARELQARRALELARNRLGYTTLTAPFAGVVTALRFESGQVLAEGHPVLTLADPGEPEVVVDLPEQLAGRLQRFSAVATPWEQPALQLPLTLRELAPEAAPQARTFRARYSLAPQAPREGLALGSSVRLRLRAVDGEPAVRLPAAALLKAAGAASVWQIDESGRRLRAQPVEVVRHEQETVLVRGLPEGARVVTAGVQKLDAAIEIVPVERDGAFAREGGS